MVILILALATAVVVVAVASRTRIQTLQRERAQLQADLAEAADRQVEIGGRLKRMERAGPREAQRARAEVLERILVLDDHVRQALSHAQGASSVAGLVEGLELLARDLGKTLEQLGLERVDPSQGETFDPTWHEAVATHGDLRGSTGVVHDVLSAGFAFGETLLRPARVVVAAAPDSTSDSDGGNGDEDGADDEHESTEVEVATSRNSA